MSYIKPQQVLVFTVPTHTKKEIREHCRAFRKSLSAKQYAQASRALCQQLLQSELIRKARVIHCYWPLTDAREPDLVPFMNEAMHQSKQIILPVVSSYAAPGAGTDRVIHRRYIPGSSLQKNKWGIYEPETGQNVPLEEIDVMIVPALAVDLHGYRIGYGAGYYDEILKGYPGVSLCPMYAHCLYNTLPRESHDVPVQQIATENSLLRAHSIE